MLKKEKREREREREKRGKKEEEEERKKERRRRKKEEERNDQQFGSEGREFKFHQCHVGLFSSGQLLLRDPMGRLGPHSHIFHI